MPQWSHVEKSKTKIIFEVNSYFKQGIQGQGFAIRAELAALYAKYTRDREAQYCEFFYCVLSTNRLIRIRFPRQILNLQSQSMTSSHRTIDKQSFLHNQTPLARRLPYPLHLTILISIHRWLAARTRPFPSRSSWMAPPHKQLQQQAENQ